MSDFVLFNNSADVHSNQLIATRTGHLEGYQSAMEVFEEYNLLHHIYIVLRQHVEKPGEPRSFTNFFGEIPQLGENPWIFEYKKKKPTK
mgnify:CR=1 FL=1